MLPIASSESRNVKVKDSEKDRDRDSQRRGKEDSLNSTSSNNTGEIQLESFKEGEEKGMKKEDGSELIGSTEAFSSIAATTQPQSSSSSTSPIKLKTWVSNLKSTVAAVSNLATSSSTSSISATRPRSNSTQSLSEPIEPVSSLVLSPSKSSLELTSTLSGSSISSTRRNVNPYDKKSKANKSAPNLGLSEDDSFGLPGYLRPTSRSDSPSLVIRNLDDAPRGSWTPQISNLFDRSSTPRLPKERTGKLDAGAQRKMTNPWGGIQIPKLEGDDGRESRSSEDEIERDVSFRFACI